jgi:SAM-dependent methyltransferase
LADDTLLDEQIAYYRRRAGEYDATSQPAGDPYAAFGEQIRQALRQFQPHGRVLEIACGTGQWTGLLAESANEVLAIDASPEMVRLARSKVNNDRVHYQVANVFDWQPPATFDVAFFGFWLSHVPLDRFVEFWDIVRRSLDAEHGRVFLADEGRHFEWREDWVDQAAGIVRRHLNDGSEHRAVKVLWDPRELAARLAELGWEGEVVAAGPFYWASMRRA